MAELQEKPQRGRPKTNDPLLPVMIRLTSDHIARVDAFATELAQSKNSGSISRSAVMRFLLEHALADAAGKPIQHEQPTADTSTTQPKRKKQLPKITDDDRKEVYTACRVIGRGQDLIPIHRIREYLCWSEEEFDHVLTSLAAENTLELHGGDSSQFTSQEINDSCTHNDTLYLTISWCAK